MQVINKLDLDNPTDLSEHGSWKYAKHIQISPQGRYSENEDKLVKTNEVNKRYIGKISIANDLVLFYADKDKLYIFKKSENYIYPKSVIPQRSSIVINDSRYYNNKIHGVHTYNYKGELIIMFGVREHKDNSPEMIIFNFDKNNGKSFNIGTKEYENILLFPNYNKDSISIDLTDVNKGGNLETGIYFTTVQYEDDYGNVSDFSNLSRPILINNRGINFEDNPTSTSYLVSYGDYVSYPSLQGVLGIIVQDSQGEEKEIPIWKIANGIIYSNIDVINSANNGLGILFNSGLSIKLQTTGSYNYVNYNDEVINVPTVKIYNSSNQSHKFRIKGKYPTYHSNVDQQIYHMLYFTHSGNPEHINSWVLPHETFIPIQYFDFDTPSFTNINPYLPSGGSSGRSFSIRFNNLNQDWKYIRIGVLYYKDNTLSNIGVTSRILNKPSLEYTIGSLDGLSETALLDILVKNAKYLTAKDSSNNNNKLVLSNLKVRGNHFSKFQKVANNIVLNYTDSRSINLGDEYEVNKELENSFANSLTAFYYQPFKYDEVYNYYIIWEDKKGGVICASHIPAIKPSGSYRTNFKTYSNTSLYTEEFGDLKGKRISFHKFPSATEINENGNDWEQVKLKLLGLKVSNVIIPEELKDICGGWRIAYAERTSDNMTRLGSLHHFGIVNRRYSFALQYTNVPTSFIKGFKRICSYPAINNPTGLEKFNTYSRFNINPSNLIPLDNVLLYKSGIDNLREDHIQANWVLGRGMYDVVTINDGKDLYTDLFNQTLVITNISGKTSDTISEGYGGDVFLSRNFTRIHDGDPEEDSAAYSRVLVHIDESIYNLENRHEGKEEFQKLYPSSMALEINEMPRNKGSYINDEFGSSYDMTYSKVNNIESPMIDDRELEDIYKNRIALSDINSSESLRLGWKTFRPDNYYDVGIDRGEIVKTVSANKVLYIQCKYGLYVARIKDVLQLADGDQAWLGTGDLFDRPPDEILYDGESSIGCDDYDSAKFSRLGYIICDRYSNSIYLISDEVKDLTRQNAKVWFTNLFDGLESDSIIIEYDNYRNRFLISILGEYTLSYNVMIDGFVSFHEYPIKDIARNTMGTYILTDKDVFEFKKIPTDLVSIIDINFTAEPTIQKLFQSVIWETEYSINGKVDWSKTIDKIMVYNNTQCTGLLDVNNPKAWYDTETGTYKSDRWFYNKLHDAVLDDKKPFLTDFEPNVNVNKLLKNWFEMSQIISKFTTIRLQSNNKNGQRIKFIKMLIEVVKDFR